MRRIDHHGNGETKAFTSPGREMLNDDRNKLIEIVSLSMLLMFTSVFYTGLH